MKASHIFTGKPNGLYNSVNELFCNNPTLLLKRIENNKYRIIKIYEVPNKALLRMRKLNLNSNDFTIHTNIKTTLKN
jgi:hypothetical protein